MDVLRANPLYLCREPELSEVWHILPVLLNPLVLHNILLVVVVMEERTNVGEEEKGEPVGCHVCPLAMSPQKLVQLRFLSDSTSVE